MNGYICLGGISERNDFLPFHFLIHRDFSFESTQCPICFLAILLFTVLILLSAVNLSSWSLVVRDKISSVLFCSDEGHVLKLFYEELTVFVKFPFHLVLFLFDLD